MKKTLIRVLALALVLILALGIIPLAALAATVKVQVGAEAYNKYPTYKEWSNYKGIEHDWTLPSVSGKDSVTIKTSDYASYVMQPDGCKYDLQGIANPKWNSHPNRPVPVSSSVTYDYSGYAWLVYTPHQHRLSYWYSDSTTHWRECLVCKKVFGEFNQFLYQNWHSDGDEDRVCDVCNADIPYHEISVIESKGGKISVELEEAPYRKKIHATVEPEEGYKLKKIHFTKVRTDGSKQEITRRKTSKSDWWTYMPTYDLEVSAEFVKKK